MRAGELLGSQVVDAGGRSLGPVRDIRVTRDGFRVVGIVVGRGPLAAFAHAWGYAEERARGPWIFAAALRPAVRRARFIPRERVLDWGPGVIRIDVERHHLQALTEVLGA